MDPMLPRLEESERRRRGRRLFSHRKIPVRMLVPNLFTLLSLCAGVTAIRMAVESRYDMAILLVVLAAMLDGVDGRLARALKAQSRFGAELDSLADFVNFGVAPAIIVYTWGLNALKGIGWIAALIFACGMGLRLARFNAMLDVEKPKWQSNYFTGMPAPAGAVVVLLPLYVDGLGVIDVRAMPVAVAIYTLLMAFLLVSTLPTFSGKLLGERIQREWVLPILVGVAGLIGFLVTYPYATLTLLVLAYLALVPVGYQRYQSRQREWDAGEGAVESERRAPDLPAPRAIGKAPAPAPSANPTGETKH